MTTTMNTGIEAPPDLFTSPSGLRAAFEQGLGELLRAHDLLGVFILVLANASFERSSYERLRDPLTAAYQRWCRRFDRADRRAQDAAADDVEVFQRLRRLGLENLDPTCHRQLDAWELQFNPLRALRPPRMSDAVVNRLKIPFDPNGFHFNKPFLRKEILWEGELADTPVRLLYNKFPFAELHGLLVPDADENRPQFLESRDHALIWRVARRLGDAMPGIGLAYNAYGAYSSVNHLHFQMFMRSTGVYPIESPHWRHNGGRLDYPLAVQRHADPDAAWSALCALHARGVSYNLLYRPGRMYLAPRAMQGSYRHAAWTGGFAWAEVAGAVTTFDPADFERLTAAEIEAEMASLAVRP